MDKTVGNYFLCIIVLIVSSSAHAKIVLRALDLKGIPITQIPAGEQFKLEIASDANNQGRMQRPMINPQEHMSIVGRESRMQIMQGISNVKHLYTVIIDTPGFYTVGPAHIEVDGKIIKSNTISITATDRSAKKATSNTSKNDKESIVFAEFKSDKIQAVVGEKIKCTLKLFVNDNTIRLQRISEPQFNGFTIESQTTPTTSKTCTVDGIVYECFEWDWYIYPTSAGKITIPALCIDFNAIVDDIDFDFFSAFTPKRYSAKRIYSNPLSITINPLPAYSGTVQAIGTIKQFSASIKPAVAREGDGMVLQIEVEGSGNLSRIETPQLINMPTTFKWYDSKNYCTQTQTPEISKKCFEYIVQGLQPGEWEVPSQQFTYFDIENKKYKVLESRPLMVTILPQAAKSVAAHKPTPLSSLATTLEVNGEIKAIQRDGRWYEQQETMIPWWIFIFFIGIPLVIIGIGLLRLWLKRIFGKYAVSNQQKKAFVQARRALKLAEHKKAYMQLYAIFLNLFAACFAVNTTELTEDMLSIRLRKAGLTQEQLQEWHIFFTKIAELIFAKKQEQVLYDDLFLQAYGWLNVLEKKL